MPRTLERDRSLALVDLHFYLSVDFDHASIDAGPPPLKRKIDGGLTNAQTFDIQLI